MKKVLVLIISLLIISSPIYSSACMYLARANKMDITIRNIDIDFDKVFLMVNVKPDDISKFIDEEKLDFPNDFGGTIFTDVKPFEKEDFIYKHKQDLEDYYVSYNIYYSYNFENSGYGVNHKYKNVDEFIKLEYSSLSNSEISKIRKNPNMVTCEREIDYTIDKLIKLDEITNYELKENTFRLVLEDFKMLNTEDNLGENEEKTRLYLRFEKEDGEFKTYLIGNNIITSSCEDDINKDELIKVINIGDDKLNNNDSRYVIIGLVLLLIFILFSIIIIFGIILKKNKNTKKSSKKRNNLKR